MISSLSLFFSSSIFVFVSRFALHIVCFVWLLWFVVQKYKHKQTYKQMNNQKTIFRLVPLCCHLLSSTEYTFRQIIRYTYYINSELWMVDAYAYETLKTLNEINETGAANRTDVGKERRKKSHDFLNFDVLNMLFHRKKFK